MGSLRDDTPDAETSMTDESGTGWSVRGRATGIFVVLLCLALMISALAPVAITGAPGASASDSVQSIDGTILPEADPVSTVDGASPPTVDTTHSTVHGSTTTATADSTPSIAIDDELEDESGTVEVVVRLEELSPPSDGVDEEFDRELQSHAADTQQELLEFAEVTDGVTVETSLWVTNAVVLTVDVDRVDLEAFGAFDEVREIHPNEEIPRPRPPTPTDPADPPIEETETDRPVTTWGIEAINATAVWDAYDTRGEGVRVAVLDTGVDATHPDIDLYTSDPSDPTYPGGWAAFDDTGERIDGSTPYDSSQHGTHVSGTVAGGNASGKHVGVAPDADLLHGQVLSEDGGSFARIVAGMEWALEEDADVISMSLGVNGTNDPLIDPVRNAKAQGVPVVAAIGNDGPETSGSPGNVYDALGVGAIDPDGEVATFSGGEEIDSDRWKEQPADWPDGYAVPDVAAPGVHVESTVPDGAYAHFHGTSMATPHVSGTVALLLAVESDATPEELEEALYETAWKPTGTPTEKDTRYGYGIVDAREAIERLEVIRGSQTETEGSEPLETDGDPPVEERPSTTASASDELRNLSPAVLLGGGIVVVAILVLSSIVWNRRRRS